MKIKEDNKAIPINLAFTGHLFKYGGHVYVKMEKVEIFIDHHTRTLCNAFNLNSSQLVSIAENTMIVPMDATLVENYEDQDNA